MTLVVVHDLKTREARHQLHHANFLLVVAAVREEWRWRGTRKEEKGQRAGGWAGGRADCQYNYAVWSYRMITPHNVALRVFSSYWWVLGLVFMPTVMIDYRSRSRRIKKTLYLSKQFWTENIGVTNQSPFIFSSRGSSEVTSTYIPSPQNRHHPTETRWRMATKFLATVGLTPPHHVWYCRRIYGRRGIHIIYIDLSTAPLSYVGDWNSTLLLGEVSNASVWPAAERKWGKAFNEKKKKNWLARLLVHHHHLT